jgi:hypothetical protein
MLNQVVHIATSIVLDWVKRKSTAPKPAITYSSRIMPNMED